MFAKVKEYISRRIAFLRLDLVEKSAKTVAMIFEYIILALAFFMFLILTSMSIAFIFSEVHNLAFGFGVVAAFFFIIFLLLVIFRKQLLETPITNMSIRRLMDKKDEQEEDMEL